MTRNPFLSSRRRWLPIIRHAADAWCFNRRRADYYDYLSWLLHGMQGSRTLKDVFLLDAQRYGPQSTRGRLSLWWAHAYQAAGGDLYATWSGSFPAAELAVLRRAQGLGNAALVSTLEELAATLRLTQQTRHILATTLWSAAASIGVLAAMLTAVPLFTVPRLMDTFSSVPIEYYGRLTSRLLGFSDAIAAHWVLGLVLATGGCGLALWSLPNTSGALRRALDRHAVWRIYRAVHALRFLALLGILLGRSTSESVQLRTAVAAQRGGSSPWQTWHIEAMLARIDTGLVGAASFDTGLLDAEHYWFLSDMIAARGLKEGLLLTSARVHRHVLGTVARQAQAMRWLLLLFCLFTLLGLAMWHYAVIDELRRSLILFYASQ